MSLGTKIFVYHVVSIGKYVLYSKQLACDGLLRKLGFCHGGGLRDPDHSLWPEPLMTNPHIEKPTCWVQGSRHWPRNKVLLTEEYSGM